MKVGDLCRVYVPPSAHPMDDHLHGMLVLILGEKYTHPNLTGEYVKGLGDKVRMFPTRWLEALQ